MAIGDAAAAAGMDLVSGSAAANTLDTEVNKTRDYIAERTDAVAPIEKGGTGQTTASAALAALGGASTTALTSGLAGKANTSHTHSSLTGSGVSFGTNSNIGGAVGFWSNARLGCAGRFYAGDDAFFSGTSAATSGYTVAYLNGDGRLSKGASSRRYKNSIRDAEDLGDTFAASLREFKLNGGDGSYRVGYIAEELEDAGLERYVVYTEDAATGDPMADSIDFIALLMAQNAQLNQRVTALEARLDALEADG